MKYLSSILNDKDIITKEFLVAGYEPKLPGAPISPEIHFLNGNKQWVTLPTSGDMTKAVYDTNNNGAVDKADSLLETRVGAIQKQWVGTKAQYNAIGTKDPNTCYITTDEPTTSFVTLDETLHIPITYIPAIIVEHSGRIDNPHNVTKTQLGLDKVSNTSDAEKQISIATQVALNLKAPLNGPVFTNRVDFNANVYFGNGYGVNGLLKSHVGLGNVDNTTDLNKPISIITQTALDLKAPISNPTFTGTVSGITKTMVGLGNVDNTTDASKPISTAVQNALNLKLSTVDPTLTGNINLSGNVTMGGIYTISGLTKSHVGLNNVDNTTDASKPISTATQTALNLKAPLANPIFTGTVSGITKAMVGLGSVDNTTDASKPISTATQTALDLKAPLVSPTFTGTVSGITSAMVGLGNVTNESKATMFTNPTFTGTVNGVSAAMVGLGNVANESKATMFTSPTFTGAVNGITKAMVGLGNVDNESKATILSNSALEGLSSIISMAEKVQIYATPHGAEQLLCVIAGGTIAYSTVAATNNIMVNIKPLPQGPSLDAILAIGKSLTCAFIVTNGATPYYVTTVKIDNGIQTVKWVGGAPTSGNANSIDVYTFTLIKTAAATYTVLGSRTKYA